MFLFPAGRQPLPESPLQRKTPRGTYVFWVVGGDAHHPVKRHFVPLLADSWVGKVGGCTSGGVAENLRQ